jgi:hypothetical protein
VFGHITHVIHLYVRVVDCFRILQGHFLDGTYCYCVDDDDDIDACVFNDIVHVSVCVCVAAHVAPCVWRDDMMMMMMMMMMICVVRNGVCIGRGAE